MSGPLRGLRVVDCSRGVAGLIASGFLADQGADVVWIEPPGGDPLRPLMPEHAVYNRSKRSVELDLNTVEGRASLDTLLKSADVFLAAWGDGVAERFGLDAPGLRERHPHLVSCAITPYGKDNADPAHKGYDGLVAARMCHVYHQDGLRPGPIFAPTAFISLSTALLALIGIFAALRRREDDGWGRHIEVSMLDGSLIFLDGRWIESEAPASTGPGERGIMRRLIVKMLRCGDGEYIAIHTGAVGAHARFMKVMGLSDRIKPASGPVEVLEPLSSAEGEFLERELPKIFETRRRDDWVEDILAADVCAMPVLRPGQIFRERQPLHNGMVARVDDPDLGALLQVASPVRFRDMPLDAPRPAPRVGQDTAAILSEKRQAASTPRSAAMERGPLLEGVKILDAGTYMAGPYSSRLLAELGAEVVKLETTAGDTMRAFVGGDVICMRGKRSIAADLKSPQGREIGSRLAAWADVVMHNMRPGAAERIGLGEAQVRKVNPQVFYVVAPGWGTSGPDMHRQAFAPMLSGYVGLQLEAAGRGNPPLTPVLGPVLHEDPVNGLWGAVAVAMGLYLRQRGAKQLYVESPLLNAAMTMVQHIMVKADTGEVLGADRLDPAQMGLGPCYRLYQAADGWISIAAATPAQAVGLHKALGVPKLGDLELSQALAARKAAEIASALTTHHVPYEIVPEPSNRDAFLQESLGISKGRVTAYEHPRFGKVRQVVPRVSSPDAAPAIVRRPCLLGEHTREILAMLGYDEATSDQLHEAKIVRSAAPRQQVGAQPPLGEGRTVSSAR
jgi:crotonobetainyl-CoA:carnitine CoA-transferase CaiB-like acyl-CoA transferase